MKVDHSTSSPIKGGEASGASAAKKAGKTEATKKTDKSTGADRAAAASGDSKAEISGRAREMAHAKSVATEAPDTREEKIAALKARIAAGKYNVDSEAVADRLVDDHIRMSGIG